MRIVLWLNFICLTAFGGNVSEKITIATPEVLDCLHEHNPERMNAIQNGLIAHAAKDHQAAFFYFHKASTLNGGNAEAMHILGLYYINGKGVEKNASFGIAYLDAAAKKGFWTAAAFLIWLYLEDEIIPKEKKMARKYSKMLCGHELEARFFLGQAIYNNAKKPQRKAIGLYLIISAAKAGFLPAIKFVNENKAQSLLAKIVIDNELHQDFRFFKSILETIRDFEAENFFLTSFKKET